MVESKQLSLKYGAKDYQCAENILLLGGEVVSLLDTLLQLGKADVDAVLLKVGQRAQTFMRNRKFKELNPEKSIRPKTSPKFPIQ